MSSLPESTLVVGRYDQVRRRVQQILSDPTSDRIGRIVSLGLIALILLNVLAVMAESVTGIADAHGAWLAGFEILSVTIFLIEYLLRVWSCTASPLYPHPLWGRIRFALTPLAIIDLLAVLPTLLLWIGMGVDLRFLRILRLARLMRIAKLGRYSRALQSMGLAVRGRREELLMAVVLMVMILVVASSLMYMAERDRQPEAFSSIPATMWWGIMTLTTVGYGDVYPITALGKLTAALVAVAGIGLFALPAGIVGSAFIELREQRKATREGACPHCGKPIPERHED
jgi:voltage-gated potassium channel